MSERFPEALVAAAWERARPSLEGRVRSLDVFVATLRNAPGAADLDAARDEAHRLAGSLGSYGLAEGTVRAREVESLLYAERLDAAALAIAIASLAAVVARGPD